MKKFKSIDCHEATDVKTTKSTIYFTLIKQDVNGQILIVCIRTWLD